MISGRELATRASRSLVWRRSFSTALSVVAMAWVIEQRRGRMVLSAKVKSPTSSREGTGSCSGERPASSRVFSRKCLR